MTQDRLAPPSSKQFGCDVDAVEQTATKLRGVCDELGGFGKRKDGYANALSSNIIVTALGSFYDETSDQRGNVHDSVDALAKMLKGLADGARDVDKALHDSLPDVESAPEQVVAIPQQPHSTADESPVRSVAGPAG